MEVVRKQNYELAAKLRDDERRAIARLDEEKSNWANGAKRDVKEITVDDVYAMVTSMTGVPITKLDVLETEKLISLEKEIGSKVIGQENAVSVISRAIRRNRVGIKDSNKPIGSFIFLGSTGVGKTYLAKTIAETLFGSPDNVIRFDMSEYMEKFNVSRLIGAPPGYVGYDEGGVLTEKVKNNPFCVILFDEIEKAHKDVYNILLQIMDEGQLTDSLGRKVNFTNTLIIMTSNVGSKKVQEYGHGLGFETSTASVQNEMVKNTIVSKALKQQFSPEFLNRIDDVVVFNPLTDEVLKTIIKLELKKLAVRLSEKNYEISFDSSVDEHVLSLNNEMAYGARPIKRIIQNLCEDFMSDEILKGNLKTNVPVTIKCDEKGVLTINVNKSRKTTRV